MAETLEVVGLHDLNILEKAKINLLLSKHKGKIKRILPGSIDFIKIHIKKYKKLGAKPKYSLHIRILTPKKIFEVEKSDWNLAKVLHISFKALENEINHYINKH
jgi:hypothetical protein|tara:strand:+ start:492 stop:803 length:312 start_codon:yes stop_codon:yes gene_type:complete